MVFRLDRADTDTMKLRKRSTQAWEPSRRRRAARPDHGAVVGLDIGATQVSAVRLRKKGSGYTIAHAAQVPLEPGVVVNGQVTDPRALARALRTLWRKGRFGTRRVCFSLAAPSVITRQVDLPWMPEPDFSLALRYQVTDALPVDLATVELGHHTLGDYVRTEGSGQSMEMSRTLLVASPTDAIVDTAECLRRANLVPIAADSPAFALIRAACGGTVSQTGALAAIVDVGHDTVTVVLHVDGQPRFLRSVASTGAGSATATIAERFGLSAADADELKVRIGLRGPVPVITPLRESGIFGGLPLAPEADADPRTQAVMTLASTWAGRVIGEVRNSLDYYLAGHPEESLSEIVLTGRGALIDGFDSRLQTELRTPVRVISLDDVARGPRRGVRVEHPHSLAIAAGLAMAS